MTNHEVDPDEHPLCWAFHFPKPGFQLDAHVIPTNDLEEHEISSECWCHPVDDHEAEDYVWLHNAKDGRETYSDTSRKLN